ncbi:MAG: hypothetical protein JNL25_12475 [Rhodospirillaceae bacterium]|nr:hypothetical protein [Rhodospirillaceae bacterium]
MMFKAKIMTMLPCAIRLGLFATLLVLAWPGTASADARSSCAEFRKSIIDMEQNSIRPPGWRLLDLRLRLIYSMDCIYGTETSHEEEYWHREDGSSTGVRSSNADRPVDGAYSTTLAHGAACRDSGISPSICALILDSTSLPQTRRIGADPLPPRAARLASTLHTLDSDCERAIATLIEIGNGVVNPSSRPLISDLAAAAIGTLHGACPDFLAAMKEQSGMDPFGDALAFAAAAESTREALLETRDGDLAAADPGFQRMCTAAIANRDQCALSRANMGPVGMASDSPKGQAGAFGACERLYAAVVTMCRQSGVPMPSHASKTAIAQEVPRHCEAIADSYAKAAQAGDGNRAYASFQKMQRECPAVVAAIAARTQTSYPTAAAQPAFPSRNTGTLTETIMGGCLNSADTCQSAANALATQTTSGAEAALFAQSLNFGLAIGNLMASGVTLGVALSQPAGPQTDMTSLTPGAVPAGQPSAPPPTPNYNNNSGISGPSGPGSGSSPQSSAPAY